MQSCPWIPCVSTSKPASPKGEKQELGIQGVSSSNPSSTPLQTRDLGKDIPPRGQGLDLDFYVSLLNFQCWQLLQNCKNTLRGPNQTHLWARIGW